MRLRTETRPRKINIDAIVMCLCKQHKPACIESEKALLCDVSTTPHITQDEKRETNKTII